MSQTSKIVLASAVAVVVLGGAYYFWQMQEAKTGTEQTTGTNSDSPETTTLPSGSSTSDASLTMDMGAIGTQIHSVGTDNGAASQSVNAAAAQ